jgi:hypothetical protein
MDGQDKAGTRTRRVTVFLGAALLVAGVFITGISTYALVAGIAISPRNPLVGLAMAAGGYFYCHRGERARLIGTALTIGALLLWRFAE